MTNHDFRDPRATEQRNPRSERIDAASSLEIVDLMHAEDRTVPGVVQGQREHIARAIDLIVTAFQGAGRLFYIGAGTSGRLGVLDAAECPPTFSVPPDLVQGIIAGGEPALSRASETTEDDPAIGARDLRERGFRAQDVLV